MLSGVRRLSKSKIGTGILVVFLLAILASFALGDINNASSGNVGLSGTTLAKAGGQEVSERDMNRAMEQLLTRARQQNPAAGYQDVARDFNPLLDSLVQGAALTAFGDKQGMNLSKRLIDAEIAKIPGTVGLNGKFSDTAYQAFLSSERLTDADVRRIIGQSLIQRLILAPAATNARLGTGLVQPYANMLLETREGEMAVIPLAAFAVGLKPSDAQLAAYYNANKARFTVPEQRTLRIARISSTTLAATPPTDQEIEAFYRANQATYGAKMTRVISQAVVPDANVAAAIAQRARSGSFVAAAQPAGLSAEDVSVGPQTLAQFKALAGDTTAAAAFAPGAIAGSVVGPIKSDLGWHVVKIESISGDAGRTLAQVRGEIVTKLAADKTRNGLGDLVNTVQDAIDDGQSFADVVARNKLSASETPLLTANGRVLADSAYKLPPELVGALKSGFELTGEDAPVVETLPGDAGFALVAVGRRVAAAPAPLAAIRDQLAAGWIGQQATARATAAAAAIVAKANSGVSLAQAMSAAGIPLEAPRPVNARRIQLEQTPPAVIAPMRMLFTLGVGKTRQVAVPQANSIALVRVSKIIPGNVVGQPALIARVQSQFQQGASQEYAQQFLNAIQAQVGIKRNDTAIDAARKRLSAAPGAE